MNHEHVHRGVLIGLKESCLFVEDCIDHDSFGHIQNNHGAVPFATIFFIHRTIQAQLALKS